MKKSKKIIDTLTFEQRKAIYLLVACDQSVQEVAEHLNVTERQIHIWQKNPIFAAKLDERFKQLELLDSKYRAKQNKQILKALYEEIQRRVADGYSLKKMKFGELSVLIKSFSNETRIDTPNDATSRTIVEHRVLDELSDRFESRKDFIPNLRLVELPVVKNKEQSIEQTKTEDKKVANG